MNERTRAENDLRVIRTLMERATIYRAISAPTALVGSVLSILAALFVHFKDEDRFGFGPAVRPREFVTLWLIVLGLTLVANAFFVWREAQKDGRPFISSGMKLAVRAIVPNLLIPAAFTAWFFTTGYLGARTLDLVEAWIAFYGLALLSTNVFAPRSLVLLGWTFLLSALAVPAFLDTLENLTDNLPNTAMGVTFGLYHLAYAVCTWTSRRAAVSEQLAVE